VFRTKIHLQREADMFLGIDLGTSGVKAVLMNESGEITAQANASLEVSRPQPLWSEQNPTHWVEAMNTAVMALSNDNDLSAVKSIGLSGQMHGATLLDSDNAIIRPAILWNDGRSQAQCDAIEKVVPNSRDITGNLAMPGFTAPKVLWVKDHEPDNFAKIAKVLLPKDYLGFILTGQYASDMSDSAGTLWLDVEKRAWSDVMLTACGLSQSQMPKLYEGHEVTGYLNTDLAKKWGMQAVPVAAGAGDNAAGAVGVGVVTPGEALLSLGTSGVFFVSNAQYAPNPKEAVHAFCHCLPKTWHQMSVILSAASCLDWLVSLTGAQDVPTLLAELEAQTELVANPQDDNTPIFLPYLTGERTPHNNPHAKGAFFGMTASTTRAHLTKAVLEGVAFAFADGQLALTNSEGEISRVSVIGGGARSTLWGQILSNILDRPLLFRDGGDVGPALGAARLAHLAYLVDSNSFTEQSIEAVCPAPAITQEVLPQPEKVEAYQARWAKYRALYEATSSLMGQ